MNVKRLNARLDRDLAKKVELIKRRTKQSDTEIVRISIDLYFQRLVEGAGTSLRSALADFVGCAEGRRDLSTRYKDLLGPTLGHKL